MAEPPMNPHFESREQELEYLNDLDASVESEKDPEWIQERQDTYFKRQAQIREEARLAFLRERYPDFDRQMEMSISAKDQRQKIITHAKLLREGWQHGGETSNYCNKYLKNILTEIVKKENLQFSNEWPEY